MRPVRSLLIYLAIVFAGGALLAPWLDWATLSVARWTASAKLAATPFPRILDRSLLGMALLGLWPLLRSCRMLSRDELGLKAEKPWTSVVLGFLLGFGSLACLVLLAVFMSGHVSFVIPSGANVFNHILSAALTAIIVAVLEEVLFRGGLFGLLRKVQPWPWALVISSGVYSLAHFIKKAEFAGPVTWLSGFELLPKMFHNGTAFIPMGLSLFMAGAILALAYQRTGSLFFSMGLHAGWVFWLKLYGYLNFTSRPSSPLWGTDKLIDGWIALPVLSCVFCIVWTFKTTRQKSPVNR